MFKSWGEFGEVRCPYLDACDLPYCQFGHDSGATSHSLIELVENEIERIESESRQNETSGFVLTQQPNEKSNCYEEIEQNELISDPVEERVPNFGSNRMKLRKILIFYQIYFKVSLELLFYQ